MCLCRLFFTAIKPEIKFLPQEEAASKWLGLAVEHGGKEVNIEDKATDQNRFWSTDVFVYVTSYENRIAYGKVELPYLEQIADFQGLDHLLLMIADAMDFVNAENKGAHYPQSTFEKRTIALKKQPANSNIYDFKGSTPVSQITPPPCPTLPGRKLPLLQSPFGIDSTQVCREY